MKTSSKEINPAWKTATNKPLTHKQDILAELKHTKECVGLVHWVFPP